MLAVAGYIIASKATRLGLDLRGGTELIYEGRPTPKVPQGHLRGDQRRHRDDPQTRRRARRLRAGDPAGGRGADLGQPAGRPERAAREGPGRHYRPAPVLRLGAERARQARAGRALLRVAGALPGGDRGVRGQAEGGGHRHPAGRSVGGDRAQVRRRPEEDPGLLRQAQRHQYDQVLPVRGDKRPLGDNGKPLKPGAVYQPASSCRELLAEYEPRGDSPSSTPTTRPAPRS